MKNLENKKILITGGAGFIGSALAHYFDQNHPSCDVIVIDKFRSDETFSNGNLKSFGHFKNLLGFKGMVLEGDIARKDTMDLIKDLRPDIIFHEAAISDTTVKEQGELINTNLNTFRDMLEICKEQNSKMIYASSAATYGNAKSPQKVWECEEPANVYGYSKIMMDHLSEKYIKNYKMHIVGLRYFNVYGKGEFYKNTTASMVLQFGHQILSGKAPRLFEGSDKIFRDFIYIKDVINANLCAIDGEAGIYNVGTGKPRSFQDIADILQKELGTDYGSEYIPNPYIGQYQFFTQADIEKTTKGLGYEPKYSLEDGIKDYIDEIKRLYDCEVKGK